MFGFMRRLRNCEGQLNDIWDYLYQRREEEMANWEDIKTKIAELKEETVRVFEVLDSVRKRLEDCLAADAVDQSEIQKAHDDIAGVVADMDHKIHADGM